MTYSLPKNIGKIRRIKDIDGKTQTFKISDEIRRPATELPNGKIIVLQYLEFDGQEKPLLRLGYYMLGKNGKRIGRWVWGQYCTIILPEDLDYVFREASERGWLT